MGKNILRNLIIFTICLFITYFLFYYFISNILTLFIDPPAFIYLGLMIFTAVTLFVITTSIINKKINKSYIDLLAVMYLITVIGLSFFKTRHVFYGINLNPFSILKDFHDYFKHTLFLVITNALLYLPLGIYIKLKVKTRNSELLIVFLVYILLIEALQLATKKGIFDINDIILNTLGFFLGILCSSLISRYSLLKHWEKSHG